MTSNEQRNLTSSEQRTLAIECGAYFHGSGYAFSYDELAAYTAAVAAYTAAVEAKERERVAFHIKEQISPSDADDEIDICVGNTLNTVVSQYKDSQPYKLGCMYEKLGAAMKNPNTKIDDLTAISLRYGIEINIVFTGQKTDA